MKDYASNSKATFDYEILDTLEGGLVLKGIEVKSIRTGKASIKGSYVKVFNNKLFLVGANIAPYQASNTPKEYDPQSDREVLIKKAQLNELLGKVKSAGITMVPLRIYDKRGLLKLEIGIAKGKKKYDKRDAIKKKDVARAKQRGIIY